MARNLSRATLGNAPWQVRPDRRSEEMPAGFSALGGRLLALRGV
jgi:hypothetical protein